MNEAIQQLADFFDCDPVELIEDGQTLRQLFEDAEANHATIYWGCWSDFELDTVVAA